MLSRKMKLFFAVALLGIAMMAGMTTASHADDAAIKAEIAKDSYVFGFNSVEQFIDACRLSQKMVHDPQESKLYSACFTYLDGFLESSAAEQAFKKENKLPLAGMTCDLSTLDVNSFIHAVLQTYDEHPELYKGSDKNAITGPETVTYAALRRTCLNPDNFGDTFNAKHIISWVNQVTVDALTLAMNNYIRQQEDIQPYFTAHGLAQYKDFIEKNKIMEFVKGKNPSGEIIISFLKTAPLLQAEGSATPNDVYVHKWVMKNIVHSTLRSGSHLEEAEFPVTLTIVLLRDQSKLQIDSWESTADVSGKIEAFEQELASQHKQGVDPAYRAALEAINSANAKKAPASSQPMNSQPGASPIAP